MKERIAWMALQVILPDLEVQRMITPTAAATPATTHCDTRGVGSFI